MSGTILALAVELVIVFVGVSAAFFVESHHRDREARKRARQVTLALSRDLREFDQVTTGFVAEIDAAIERWWTARSRGEQPAPAILRIPGAERPPIGVWSAVLELQAADLLDPELLFELASFYSEIDGMGDRYVRYTVFTEREVLPRLREPGSFYDEVTGELRPSFESHMELLSEIGAMMKVNVEWSRTIAGKLHAQARRLGARTAARSDSPEADPVATPRAFTSARRERLLAAISRGPGAEAD